MNNFVALNAFFFDDSIEYNKEIIERNKNVWLVFEQKLALEPGRELQNRIDLLIITKYNGKYCCEVIELKQHSNYKSENINKNYNDLIAQMAKYRNAITIKYPNINIYEKAIMYNMDYKTIKQLNDKYDKELKSKNHINNDDYNHKFFNLNGNDEFIKYFNKELKLDKGIDQFDEEELINFLSKIY